MRRRDFDGIEVGAIRKPTERVRFGGDEEKVKRPPDMVRNFGDRGKKTKKGLENPGLGVEKDFSNSAL